MWHFTALVLCFIVVFGQIHADPILRQKRSLLTAARDGNLNEVENLLKGASTGNINVNIKNNDGWTPLHEASFHNHYQIAELLIKNGADKNAITNEFKYPPINLAAIQGHTNIVELLIREGAKIDFKNRDGWTALHESVFHRHEDVVKLLIKSGADVNNKNKDGWSLLHEAAGYGFVEIAEILIKNGADKNALTNEFRYPPINIAAMKGHKNAVELLIREGAKIDVKNRDGWTALHEAVAHGHDEVVELLIRSGADINNKNKDGWSLLHEAVNYDFGEIAEILMKNGADINSLNNNRMAPINIAAQQGRKNMVELLIRHNVDINNKNKDGWTALHESANSGFDEIAELLIKNGADKNSLNNNRMAPINIAAQQGHKDVLVLLVRNGANINNKNQDGWTPLHEAAYHGFEQIVDYLIKSGAKKDIKNNSGKIPADLAAERNHTKITKLFDRLPIDIRITSAEEACQIYSKMPMDSILGGEEAKEGEFPWMAALGYLNLISSQELRVKYRCGGSLISDKFVLTAAHCTKISTPPVVVRLGKLSLLDDDSSMPDDRLYQIQQIINHPDYSPRLKTNDIALIKLGNKLYFTPKIRPACLQIDIHDENFDTTLIVSGWGSTSSDRSIQSTILRKAELKAMPLSQCNATLLELNEKASVTALQNGIHSGQYCAYDPSSGGADSCAGDSGGPLQVFRENSKTSTIVGIISYGFGCGNPTLPGIYTRVAYYKDWIEKNVWGN